MLHKAVQAGKIAKRVAWMIGAAYDVGVGTGWDIAVHGRTPSESFARNLFSFAAGEAVGAGVSRLASRVFRRGASTGVDAAARRVDDVAEAAARQADNAAARIRTARRPGAESGASLAQRRTWFADETEKFYRAMSENEYSRVIDNSGLAKRSRGSSELFVTTVREYTEQLITRRKIGSQYPVVVEFEVQAGTTTKLFELAAAHDSTTGLFKDLLPTFVSRMDAVQVKFETLEDSSNILSFGLGTSKLGLSLFNNAIIFIRRIR